MKKLIPESIKNKIELKRQIMKWTVVPLRKKQKGWREWLATTLHQGTKTISLVLIEKERIFYEGQLNSLGDPTN